MKTEDLNKLKGKRVFVQYPEGLTMRIQKIVDGFKDDFEAVISCEPCYGACDIKDDEAKRLGCDAILHIAHSDFGIKSDLPIVYWDYFIDVDPLPALKKEIKKLDSFKRIGFITSAQFIDAMNKTKDYLDKAGKETYVHKALKYPGQVLGCNVKAAKTIESKVGCFLYVGAGKFYPLSVALATEKPTFNLDLERSEIVDMKNERMKYLKKKAWNDVELKEAKTVGIIVCWKRGQNRIDEALELKKKLESEGKKVYIFAFDRVTDEKLEGLKVDCFVGLACPRLDLNIYS